MKLDRWNSPLKPGVMKVDSAKKTSDSHHKPRIEEEKLIKPVSDMTPLEKNLPTKERKESKNGDLDIEPLEHLKAICKDKKVQEVCCENIFGCNPNNCVFEMIAYDYQPSKVPNFEIIGSCCEVKLTISVDYDVQTENVKKAWLLSMENEVYHKADTKITRED